MTLRALVARIGAQEDINFLLTNRLPRRFVTRLMGRVSRIEQPLVRRASIALWTFFCDVDLNDAAEPRFASLHAAFTRALRPGARPPDPDPAILASPCDAIVGACGSVEEDRVHQIKGSPYSLCELLGDACSAIPYRGGCYITLRLTAGMYHRFHAPSDLIVDRVDYISGDTWNVNPIALRRVERLFCRNERAILHARLAGTGEPLLLVAVAAILVAGIRLKFLDTVAMLREGGSRSIAVAAPIARGGEMGWFEHGSTILMFAPPGFKLLPHVREGARIRAGQGIMARRQTDAAVTAASGNGA